MGHVNVFNQVQQSLSQQPLICFTSATACSDWLQPQRRVTTVAIMITMQPRAGGVYTYLTRHHDVLPLAAAGMWLQLSVSVKL